MIRKEGEPGWDLVCPGQWLGEEEPGYGEDVTGRSRTILGERQVLTFPVEA